MTEYTVKIPLEDDVAEALQIYADKCTMTRADLIKNAVKMAMMAMQELVSKSFEVAASKKAADYRHNATVEVGFAVEIPEDEEGENDGD